MTALIIISIILAALGLGAAVFRNDELPESMSALVYSLKKQHRWLWSVWIWSMAFTAGIPMIDALGGTWWLGLTGFVTTGCLGVVGAMPLIAGKANFPQYLLAIFGGILSQICVILINPWALLVWVLFFLLINVAVTERPWAEKIRKSIEGKGTLIVEAFCALAVYAALLSNY